MESSSKIWICGSYVSGIMLDLLSILVNVHTPGHLSDSKVLGLFLQMFGFQSPQRVPIQHPSKGVVALNLNGGLCVTFWLVLDSIHLLTLHVSSSITYQM
jgi:hypothetical protein